MILYIQLYNHCILHSYLYISYNKTQIQSLQHLFYSSYHFENRSYSIEQVFSQNRYLNSLNSLLKSIHNQLQQAYHK